MKGDKQHKKETNSGVAKGFQEKKKQFAKASFLVYFYLLSPRIAFSSKMIEIFQKVEIFEDPKVVSPEANNK